MRKKQLLELVQTRLEKRGFAVEITDTEIIGRLAGGEVEERVPIRDIMRKGKKAMTD